MENPTERLTTDSYWKGYYGNTRTDKSTIIDVVGVYNTIWDLLINQNDNKFEKEIIEIGGYPGRYLAYLSDRYKLIPTSLDYNSDRAKIEANMHAMGVENFTILHEDFLEYVPTKTYDVLLSIGFIEHFSNFNDVLDRHLLYMKKGSTLYINIPNMRYYSKWYKLIVDKQNLNIHNLACMDLDVFKNFATRNNLEILDIGYYGGFQFTVHQPLNLVQRFIFESHRFIFKRFLNKYIKKKPNKFFSSNIYCVLKVR